MPSTQGGAAGFLKNMTDLSICVFHATVTDPSYMGQNVAISTFPLNTALSVIYWGSSGVSATELAVVLRLEELDREMVLSHYHYLTKKLKEANETNLHIASKIFVRAPMTFTYQFQYVDAEKFNFRAEMFDISNTERAAWEINRWIEQNTNGQVRNSVDESTLNFETEIITIVATSFKSTWPHSIIHGDTREAPFWHSETESETVDTIFFSGDFRYSLVDELKAEAIEIPYDNKEFSLLVLLPQNRCGINILENNLKSSHYQELQKSMAYRNLDVRIPEFHIEFGQSLQDILEKIGMSCIFADSASFDWMLDRSEEDQVRMSQILQKTVIEIKGRSGNPTNDRVDDADNTGALQNSPFSLQQQQQEQQPQQQQQEKKPSATIVADHPFVFIIKWNRVNIPLIMGIMHSPNQMIVPRGND